MDEDKLLAVLATSDRIADAVCVIEELKLLVLFVTSSRIADAVCEIVD